MSVCISDIFKNYFIYFLFNKFIIFNDFNCNCENYIKFTHLNQIISNLINQYKNNFIQTKFLILKKIYKKNNKKIIIDFFYYFLL